MGATSGVPAMDAAAAAEAPAERTPADAAPGAPAGGAEAPAAGADAQVAEPPAKRPRHAPSHEAVVAEAPAGDEAPEAPAGDKAAPEQPAPARAEGAESSAGASQPSASPPRVETGGRAPLLVEVSGAAEPGYNQLYRCVLSSQLLAGYSARTGLKLRPWAQEGADDWVYEAESGFGDGRGAPYLWCQRRGGRVEWKLAVPGDDKSSYGCYLGRNQAFPEGLRSWRYLRGGSRDCRGLSVRVPEEGRELPEAPQPSSAASVDGACPPPMAALCSAPRAFPGVHPDDPTVLPSLGPEEAERFFRRGYLVLRSEALGTSRRAARALHAMSFVLCELAAAGLMRRAPDRALEISPKAEFDGLHSVRVYSREEYSALLSPVRGLLAQMFGEEPELPPSCQLAFGMPDGGIGENFEGRGEERPDDEYHIDGRGAIPNGFALLVGIALSSPPEGSSSWGAFAVYPGSHRNSVLHEQYPHQKARGGKEGRLRLGPPEPVHLQMGDIVVAHSLLAHRRSQNWSPAIRYQIYFRVRPRRAASDPAWESGLPANPFAALPGILAARRSQE